MDETGRNPNTYGISANWPESVQVRFRTKICPNPICDPEKPPPEYYIKEVKIDDTGVNEIVSGGEQFKSVGYPGYYVVHDSAVAVYDGSATDPTNKTEIDDLATQIAKDFYLWRSFRFDIVYNHVIIPDMDATIDTAEIIITANDARTRITSAPFNGEPEEFSHYAEVCTYPTPVVYVPTATRHGNYLRLPKAKLIENRFEELYLCTSSFDDIFVCCNSQSSSSSSSTSHACPTFECPEGCGNGVSANCVIQFTVTNVTQCTGVPSPSCVCLNGEYHLRHTSGCSWIGYAFDSAELPECATDNMNFPPTSSLSLSGGTWTFEITDGVNIVTWESMTYSCVPADVFAIQSALNCCTVPAPSAVPVE